MPSLLTLLNFIIAIAACVHVFKNNSDRYWIFILIVFPFVGPAAYLIVVILPDLSRSRKGRKLKVVVNNSLRPNAGIEKALEQFEINPCVANRVQLADALMSQDRIKEAIEHYQLSLSGANEYNPDIMLKLAIAYLESNAAAESISTLELLRTHNPSYNSPFGHLIYARALAANHNQTQAVAEFEALVHYYSGYEAKVRYAEYLQSIGDDQRAMALINEVLAMEKRADRFVKDMNSEWISLAKKLSRKA